MKCKACFHPQRNIIDQQIIAGRPLRALVATFGISLGALHRHKTCIRELIKECTADERREHGASLLSRVESLVAEGQDICAKAKAAGKFAAASNALNSVARSLELIGKLTGEFALNTPGIHLSLHQTVNVTNFDSDEEFAAMVGEATGGFSIEELMRLKQIAEGQKALPACNVLAIDSK